MKRILLSLLVLGMFLSPNNASSNDVCFIDEYASCSNVSPAQCNQACRNLAYDGCDIWCETDPSYYWSVVYYDPYCPEMEACYCEFECPFPPPPTT